LGVVAKVTCMGVGRRNREKAGGIAAAWDRVLCPKRASGTKVGVVVCCVAAMLIHARRLPFLLQRPHAAFTIVHPTRGMTLIVAARDCTRR